MNKGLNTILNVSQMSVTIKNQKILKDISFQIQSNEILSIIGHSGAGKSTLLRTLNGLTDLSEGTIEFDDLTIMSGQSLQKNDVIKLHHNISLVFQNYNLFPHMSVIDNLIIARKLNGDKNKGKLIEEAKGWLKLLKLENKEDMYPYQLSGGEKQRVAIARACMLSPKILCLDEPTSALDQSLIQELSMIIKNLRDKMSIMIITHDLNFATKISDRIIQLENGIVTDDLTLSEYMKKMT